MHANGSTRSRAGTDMEARSRRECAMVIAYPRHRTLPRSRGVLQPFEVVTAKLLPTIRARLAQVLLDEHHMKQVEVAKQLGITQAAVSHYKTMSRGTDAELVRLFPEIDAFVRGIAARIADGMPQTEQVLEMSQLVERRMNTQRFCDYHKKVAASDPMCSVCFPTPPKP